MQMAKGDLGVDESRIQGCVVAGLYTLTQS